MAIVFKTLEIKGKTDAEFVQQFFRSKQFDWSTFGAIVRNRHNW